MQTDINGCSTTESGQEKHEHFYSKIARGYRVQYDYRTPDGVLFFCIAKSLNEARNRRDAWLLKRGDALQA